MRRMTDGAILSHWGVLPKEWTSLIGMTLVTGLVDTPPIQQQLTRGAVGLVTV